MPTLFGVLQAIWGALSRVVTPLLLWMGGRASARSDGLERGNERLRESIEARDRVKSDPGERDRLRDKYRRG